MDGFVHQTIVSVIGNDLRKKGFVGFLEYPIVDFLQLLSFGDIVLVYHELVDVSLQQLLYLMAHIPFQPGKRDWLDGKFVQQLIGVNFLLNDIVLPLYIVFHFLIRQATSAYFAIMPVMLLFLLCHYSDCCFSHSKPFPVRRYF